MISQILIHATMEAIMDEEKMRDEKRKAIWAKNRAEKQEREKEEDKKIEMIRDLIRANDANEDYERKTYRLKKRDEERKADNERKEKRVKENEMITRNEELELVELEKMKDEKRKVDLANKRAIDIKEKMGSDDRKQEDTHKFTVLLDKYWDDDSNNGSILKLVNCMIHSPKSFGETFLDNPNLVSQLNPGFVAYMIDYVNLKEDRDVVLISMIRFAIDMIEDVESEKMRIPISVDPNNDYYIVIYGEIFHPMTETLQMFKDYDRAFAYAKSLYSGVSFGPNIIVAGYKPKPMFYLRVYRRHPE